MNNRERFLSIATVSVIVLVAGAGLVRKLYLDPLRDMDKRIALEEQRATTLDNIINGRIKTWESWQAQTGKTLSSKPAEAHEAFRSDISVLLKRHGLTGISVAAGEPHVIKKGLRKGFTELPVRVHGKGKLKQVVDFLRDFYQRPYLAHVASLRLNARDTGRANAKRGKKKNAGAGRAPVPELDISLVLSTLVLPTHKEVPHKPLDLAAFDGGAGSTARAKLRRDVMSEYDEIVSANVFKEYVPAASPKRDPPTKKVVKATTPKKATPTPARQVVDPRRDAKHFVVQGTASIDGAPIVYVADERKRTIAPSEYRLNDEVDDGRLVLVHSTGIVVRASRKVGTRTERTNYFYELGKSFADRVEVAPAEHPQIAELLRVVMKTSGSSPS